MKHSCIFIFAIFIFVLNGNAQIISAMQVPGDVSKVRLDSKAWLSSDPYILSLYEKHNLQFKPQSMNLAQAKQEVIEVKIKALHNGKHIAFLIEWEDEQKNTLPKNTLEGMIFQFPSKIESNGRLPYIYMGDPSEPIIAHFIKTKFQLSQYQSIQNENFKFKTSTVREFVSGGFGALNEILSDAFLEISYDNGEWKSLLVRPLEDEFVQFLEGVVPVSFTIWKNIGQNKENKKYLSSWIGVKLVGKSGGSDLVEKLTKVSNGNPQRGKALSLKHCAQCHQFPGGEFANPLKAPRLHGIGGVSTYDYFTDSIINPNEVIVPNPYSNTDFPWFSIDDAGIKTSLMPSFQQLDKEEVEDIIAFLQSLK